MSDYERGTARSVHSINDELEKIQNAISDQLDRNPDSGQSNEMNTDLDMNGNRIYNLPEPTTGHQPVTKDLLDETVGNIVSESITIIGGTKSYPNLATSKGDLTLQLGGTVYTQGYNIPNDGGGARYVVVAGGTGVDDGGLYHNLNNGLQLELVVEDRVGLAQYGVKSEVGFDNVVQIQRAFLGQLIHRKPILVESTLTGYECSGTVKYYGWGLEGVNAEGSKLVYTGNSTFIEKASSNDWGTISNLYIFGSGKLVSGSCAFGHLGNDRGWFRTQLKNVRVNDFERAFEIQFSLFCTFDTVFVANCKEGHYFVGSNTGWNNAGGWYNNEITFQNCIWDECDTFAVDWIGAGLSFSGTNTMQSGGDGLRIKRDSGGISSTVSLDNLYFEFNSGKDIDLKDTFVTLGTCVFQNDNPPPSHNIYADNTQIYAVGRPKYLDSPNFRIELVNSSKYISIYPEIVSNAIINDSTSEYVYLPDRVSDKRVIQTFTNLSTSGVTLAPPLDASSRYTDYIVEFYLQAPNGEYTAFTTYGRKSGGTFRTPVISGDAVRVSDYEFTVTVGGFVYTLRTVAGSGTMTIESNVSTTGDTVLTSRVTNSLFDPIY